jgi:hypothetical protein
LGSLGVDLLADIFVQYLEPSVVVLVLRVVLVLVVLVLVLVRVRLVLGAIPSYLYSDLFALSSVKLRCDETCVIFMLIYPNAMSQLYFVPVKL